MQIIAKIILISLIINLMIKSYIYLLKYKVFRYFDLILDYSIIRKVYKIANYFNNNNNDAMTSFKQIEMWRASALLRRNDNRCRRDGSRLPSDWSLRK